MFTSLFLTLSSILFLSINGQTMDILMPDAVANQVDEYLCTSFRFDDKNPTYITAFNPSATSEDAHHILLFGCTEPGSEKKIWNCGEMSKTNDKSYETAPVCGSGQTIIYAWALDADKTELPKDVAFKIGGSTSVKHLVLQVHYANIDKFKAGKTDRSGLVLTTTSTPTSKRAGVFVLGTGGSIAGHSEEIFQVACKIPEEIVMHPFAFRTHTHRLGLLNSGYRVRGSDDDQIWTEIGRRSPQLPQMFYPTQTNLTIEQGDYIAAACTMFNTKPHTVYVGPTGDDEMCNYYIMYWVEGDQLLKESFCQSAGPPSYYFRNDENLNVDKIPADAFRVPSSSNVSAHHSHSHQAKTSE